MAFFTLTAFLFLFFLLLLGVGGQKFIDPDYVEVALNLEFIETEYFLHGALGVGLDTVHPGLSRGGPPPVGAKKANLDPFIQDIMLQFGYQEVGHLRAILNNTKGFPRPQLNLSKALFADIMNKALGVTLDPPFDPYLNSINFLLGSYIIPYNGIGGYTGAMAKLQTPTFKTLVASLLAVESGQDAVIRSLLYQFDYNMQLWGQPYGFWLYPEYSIADITDRISGLRNSLGGAGVKDEGIVVEKKLGAEGKITGNVLVGDPQSVAYGRAPNELFRILYMTGKENVPGGFLTKGGDGKIAKSFLKSKLN